MFSSAVSVSVSDSDELTVQEAFVMNWGAFLSGSAAVFVQGTALMLTYETYALTTRKVPPITAFVRHDEQDGGAHPFMLLFAVVAMIIGHLLWH